MADDKPAVLIAEPDGGLLDTNLAAEDLLGEGHGTCRDLLEAQPGTRDLPCRDGCSERLVRGGAERVRSREVQLHGRPATMTCVPVDDRVVVTLQPHQVAARGPWEQLTPREREVLERVAEGLETPAIARDLGVSQATIRTHVQHMRQKLGVATRAGLVARAFRLGWLR